MVSGSAGGTGKGGRKQNISADVGITRPKEMVVVEICEVHGLLLVHVSF